MLGDTMVDTKKPAPDQGKLLIRIHLEGYIPLARIRTREAMRAMIGESWDGDN
jgi:hypothetical protein